MESVYYAFDSSNLDESARNTLTHNAQCVQSKANRNVAVVGMADPRGTEEYNMALGDRRARAAMQYMTTLGVNEHRMRAHSVGEEYAAGSDDAGWTRDRRSEFSEE